MSLRVLHVAQPSTGGVPAYVRDAALDQAARGWDIAVALDDAVVSTSLREAGVRVTTWRATREPGPGPATLLEIRRLHAVVADVRPDVVHLHSAKAGLAGRLALRGRVPTIFQPHGWSWLAVEGGLRAAAERWERHAVRWTDLLITVGEGEAEEGRRRAVHGHQAVVRNGVDRSRFRPAGDVARRAARVELGLDPVAPLVVCAGRVTRQKGQDVLMAAWPEVGRRCQGAQLRLVGDVQSPGPALYAPGVGWTPGVVDVLPWLVAADLVVVPSRWEGLALTVMEALACGRPVVASDVAGIRELMTGGTGDLVRSGDAGALAEAIVHRLGSPVVLAREGAAAARSAVAFDARRTWDRLAELTAAVPDGFLPQRGRPSGNGASGSSRAVRS